MLDAARAAYVMLSTNPQIPPATPAPT